MTTTHGKYLCLFRSMGQGIIITQILLMHLPILHIGCRQENAMGHTDSGQTTVAEDGPPAETQLHDTAAHGRSMASNGRVIMRLFWQDMQTATLHWGDVIRVKDSQNSWRLIHNRVANFPELDVEQQHLVQMNILENVLLVGVRGDGDSTMSSGWIAVDTGVEEQDHGDHYHWHYHEPKVLSYVLDDKQGNPAHLYLYGRYFFLAQDKLNGFLRLDPMALKNRQPAPGQFYQGGGNHITLAVWKDKYAFATWIDRQGENAGRVDVVDLQEVKIAESLTLPVGGLHGATVCGNRVFFAPSQAIYYISVETTADGKLHLSEPEKLDLGKVSEDGPAFRTGAFAILDHLVLFSSSLDGQGFVGIIDNQQDTPKLQKVSIPLIKGQTLSSVWCWKSRSNKKLAATFAETPGSDQSDVLYLVDLDPNGDGQVTDAAIWKDLQVGTNRIEGHAGHHGFAWNARGTLAAVTSPGSGSVLLINLRDGTILATWEIGGTPTTISALGGPSG